MKHALFILFISLYSLTAISQPDIKSIKKQIPVKGIKTVEPVDFSKELFIFQSKTSKGLWNVSTKKILLDHIVQVSPNPYNNKWVNYQTINEYGIYDLAKDQSILASSTAFHLDVSLDSNFILIMSLDVFGVIDLQRMSCYVVNSKNPPKDVISFFDEPNDNGYETYSIGCSYDPDQKTISYYGYESDMIQNVLSIYCLDDYLIESQSGYVYGMKVHQRSTGELKLDMYGGDVQKWKDGYTVVSNQVSYYDQNFNPIFENISQDGHTLEHFQKLLNDSITKAEYAGDGMYTCKMNGKYAFFSILPMERVTDWYDYIYYLGLDIHTNGQAYYTINNDHFGLYNTWRGVELDSKYHLIELRIFNDTTYGYRADDELIYLKAQGTWSKYWVRDTVVNKWTNELLKTSMPINHLSVKDDSLLILSLRNCEPDVHDYSYGTSTSYENGSGVLNINTKKWVIKPDYHCFMPFKGHYITSDVGSTYRNWTKTQILDENFKPITKEELDGSFIYQDQLITRNKKWERIIYDVANKKVSKILGKASAPFEDFLLKDGYLLIGSYNYDRDGNIDGFDIDEIISPEYKLVTNDKFGIVKMLPNELIIIGEYFDKSERSYKRDYYGRSEGPKKQAIYDLKKNAIVSQWYTRLYVNEYDNTITMDKQEVKLNELRKYFKLN